jgi:bacterioferritin (cytochrome b1)
MTDSDLDADLTSKVIASLNRILELELAGVVRYMHYSFMIFGHNRIPIVAWLREQSNESNAHAVLAGEHITAFGGHPSLKIGGLLETHQHDVNEILKEAFEHEKGAWTRTTSCSGSPRARASCSRNTRATRSPRKRCTWRTSAR